MQSQGIKKQQSDNTKHNHSVDKISETTSPSERTSINPLRFPVVGGANPPDIPLTPQNIHFLKRAIGNQALSRMIQAKLKIGQHGDKYEQEADRMVDQVIRMGESKEHGAWRMGTHGQPEEAEEAENVQTKPLFQRQAVEQEEQELPEQQVKMNEEELIQPILGTKSKHLVRRQPADVGSTPTPAPTQTEPTTQPTPDEATAPELIVEDTVEDLQSGQMKKGDFLAVVREEVSKTVEPVIASTGRTADKFPYLVLLFRFLAGRSIRYINQTLRKFTPAASNLTTARGYIPIIKERVRQSAEVWVRTGDITGLPSGVPTDMVKTSLTGSIGGIFFKGREGGPKEAGDPQAIQTQLGSGHSLEGSTKSRMDSAFGQDFSDVRVHTGPVASHLSNKLNARAFTVGKDIAFGSGEYQPGSPVGDAILAHELAHTVQQGGRNNTGPKMAKTETSYNALEEDADLSAMGTVISLWGLAKGSLANIARNALPRLKSGLRLQRCGREKNLEKAEKKFKEKYEDLGSNQIKKIIGALNKVAGDNETLLLKYYNIYLNKYTIKIADEEKSQKWKKRNDSTYMETLPVLKGLTLTIRNDVLTGGFSDETVGGFLMHEAVHTTHGDLAEPEGRAYGIEMAFAERTNDTKRIGQIKETKKNKATDKKFIDNYEPVHEEMKFLFAVIDEDSKQKELITKINEDLKKRGWELNTETAKIMVSDIVTRNFEELIKDKEYDQFKKALKTNKELVKEEKSREEKKRRQEKNAEEIKVKLKNFKDQHKKLLNEKEIERIVQAISDERNDLPLQIKLYIYYTEFPIVKMNKTERGDQKRLSGIQQYIITDSKNTKLNFKIDLKKEKIGSLWLLLIRFMQQEEPK